jgi:outer membrane lipoprotein-sorting protein
MFKLLLSGIIISPIALAGNIQAQIPPASTTPVPQSQPNSPTATPLKASDLSLLTRAVGKFWQTDIAETESQMEIDSYDEKGKNKAFVSVKTIAKVGKKFRSELTIDRVNQKSKIKYTIVSNGEKVWIYRPDIRQYAEISIDDFYSKPAASIIGLFSITFISLGELQRQELITDILGEQNQILSLESLKKMQVDQQQIGKQSFLSVYTYSDRNDEVSISGFINPQMGMFDRIAFKFGDKQSRTEMVEKMIRRNSKPTITDKTFTFSPPKGVKKVKSLQTEPFNFK